MQNYSYRRRRLVLSFIAILLFLYLILSSGHQQYSIIDKKSHVTDTTRSKSADILDKLEVKSSDSETGYDRKLFGNGWSNTGNCDTRNLILYRDLTNTKINENCIVTSGILNDPYTGEIIIFNRSNGSSVQIDHVVALSDAWEKGAKMMTDQQREVFANDPLELLAVSGKENQAKGDGDASEWLPRNRMFRCEYVSRQIAVKFKYKLWITRDEYDAIYNVLLDCSGQLLPSK